MVDADIFVATSATICVCICVYRYTIYRYIYTYIVEDSTTYARGIHDIKPNYYHHHSLTALYFACERSLTYTVFGLLSDSFEALYVSAKHINTKHQPYVQDVHEDCLNHQFVINTAKLGTPFTSSLL